MSWKAAQDYDMIFGWAFDRASVIREKSTVEGCKPYTVEDVIADADKIIEHAQKYVMATEVEVKHDA